MPLNSLRRILENNTLSLEVITYLICKRKVLVLPCRVSLLNELFDIDIKLLGFSVINKTENTRKLVKLLDCVLNYVFGGVLGKNQ